MITVGMNYNVIPGKDEQFVAVFTKVLQTMNEMPGHLKTHLYRDVASEHEYLIVSEWNDEDAFDSFVASDKFKKITDWGKAEILSGRPRHEIYGSEKNPQGKCPV